MKHSLGCAVTLAHRYAQMAREQQEHANEQRRAELSLMEKPCVKCLSSVPKPCRRPSYVLLWQIMCLEQAPNPFAFSVGNADRIFEPYRNDLSREEAAALFKHFLVFFNVGKRSWAISQNVLISGKDTDGTDLTNEMCDRADAWYCLSEWKR